MDNPKSLGSEMEAFVEGLVESGRFESREDVLRESVRLMQEREARLEAINAGVERGIADAAAGRVRDAAAVFDELDAEFQAMVDTQRR